MFQNIVQHLLEHPIKEYRSLILKAILSPFYCKVDFKQAGPAKAFQIEAHGLHEADLCDPVRMQTFGQIAHVVNDLIEHLTAVLHAFICGVLLIKREDGKGKFDHGEDLADIIMELHGDGLKGSLLDLQLGPEQFLLVLILHARQLLFLPVLATLVEEKGSDDKANEQQSNRNRDKDHYIDVDLWVLSRHKKAIVNDKYKQVFMITRIVKRVWITLEGILLIKLTNPNWAK